MSAARQDTMYLDAVGHLQSLKQLLISLPLLVIFPHLSPKWSSFRICLFLSGRVIHPDSKTDRKWEVGRRGEPLLNFLLPSLRSFGLVRSRRLSVV